MSWIPSLLRSAVLGEESVPRFGNWDFQANSGLDPAISDLLESLGLQENAKTNPNAIVNQIKKGKIVTFLGKGFSGIIV